MTELHCHILPGIDDGAKDVHASIELLRMEKKDGVDNIVFTPHFHCDRIDVDGFIDLREKAFGRLKEALKNEPDLNFNMKLGAEVYFSPGLRDVDLAPLCFTDTSYMLIEFPTSHKPAFIKETLYNIQSIGITPIIAHVERYGYVLEDLTILYEWVQSGACVQINAGSLIRNDKLSALLLKLINWNLVHVISTDTHSVERRPPNMAPAIDLLGRKSGSETLDRIVTNGDDIFDNVEISVYDLHYPKKVLGRWV